MDLKKAFLSRISDGLQRSAINTPSKWACNYRYMSQPIPGKWTFNHHPWLKAIHDSPAKVNVGQKSAQIGFTEAALNISFFTIDVLGKDVLYVLPSKNPHAKEFSASRFDVALDGSDYLRNLFSEVKNVGHKRAGSRNLYIRGSRSRTDLKSVSVYLIILDELDEMSEKNVPLAFERAAGQLDYRTWLISTPTTDGRGINKYFNESTQNHYFFRCPSCSQFIQWEFPESLIITAENPNDPAINQSHYICTNCSARLDHNKKIEYYKSAEWVPKYKHFDFCGWHINRLYSTVLAGNPVQLAKHYLRSLTDPTEEQEFYNSALGLPHVVKGGRVTDADISQCICNFVKFNHRPRDVPIVTMGIDQGGVLHYEIDAWQQVQNDSNDLSNSFICTVLDEGHVNEYEQLSQLFSQYSVNFAVIDAQPERRKAIEFAHKHYGRVRLCFYPEGINTKQIHISSDEPQISVDRTVWLDTSLSRFRNKTIRLPSNISLEYKNHVKALVRRYERDKNGNPIGRYRRDSRDDHLAHARNYAEIALHLAASIGRHEGLSGIL